MGNDLLVGAQLLLCDTHLHQQPGMVWVLADYPRRAVTMTYTWNWKELEGRRMPVGISYKRNHLFKSYQRRPRHALSSSSYFEL